MRQTIAESGWAVVAVGGQRAHAFTVGLWHSYGIPELAMFGLTAPDMQQWLNSCVEELAQRGTVPDGEPFTGVLDQYPVLLREMDVSWEEPLFGTMCGYYGAVDAVPVRQVIWPDRHGLWPWEDGATESSRDAQPLGWLPVTEHPDGGWRLVAEYAADWPFAVLEPDTLVTASAEVVRGDRPIVAVTHDESGGWDFLDERGYAEEADGTVHFGQLYRGQPWLVQFAELPPDTQAWLDADGEWRTRPFSETESDAALYAAD